MLRKDDSALRLIRKFVENSAPIVHLLVGMVIVLAVKQTKYTLVQYNESD